MQLQSLAPIFVERVLNSAAEGVVLAGLVWALLRLVRRQSSGNRFTIWFGALLAIVALPLFAGSGFASSHLSSALTSWRDRIMIPSSWASLLFVVWAAGAGFLLLRLIIGLWRVHRFRSACYELDQEALDPALTGILRDFAPSRRVRLLVSDVAMVPAAIGFFRPAIVFPAWLLPKLSADEIKLILLHELAHLRRWDDWTNLAQKVVKALFFFHPGVWWIERQLTLEREMACDDIVLAQNANPRAYASSLISFAEKLQSSRAIALAQALVGRIHQMSPRVARILDAKEPRSTRLCRSGLGLSFGLVALVFGAASYTPPIVSFRSPADSGRTPMQMAQRRSARSENLSFTRPIEAHAIQARFNERSFAPSAPRARMISAAPVKTRPAVVPLKFNAEPQRHTPAVQANAAEKNLVMHETIVIVRTQFNPAGAGTWTLCIWRVESTPQSNERLDPTVYVGLI